METGNSSGLGSGNNNNAYLQRRRTGNRGTNVHDRMIPDTPGRRRVSGIISIQQLRPLLDKNQTLANLVRGIDHFCFIAMNVIRRFPKARLAFLIYMLTLHVWSIFLVSHHASNCRPHSGTSTKNIVAGSTHIPGAMPKLPGPPIHQ